MKKILTIGLLFAFKLVSAQVADDRFIMKVSEPKSMKGESIAENLAADPRISSLFKIEVIKSRKIKKPTIEIFAPDGVKMGTCFLTCYTFSPGEFDYYRQIESRTRSQWENMKTLPSYKEIAFTRH